MSKEETPKNIQKTAGQIVKKAWQCCGRPGSLKAFARGATVGPVGSTMLGAMARAWLQNKREA